MTPKVAPMTEIQFDRKVVDDGISPGIPEIVRYKTQHLIQHARRVTVEAPDRSGKFAKYNGFKLTQNDDDDGYPVEEVEDVCEAIMRLVNAKFREAQASDPEVTSMNFRAVFDRRPNGKRERPGIDLENYSPDGPDLPIGHGMTNIPQSADGFAGEVLAESFQQLGGLVDKLMLRVDGLIGHIVGMSDQHKEMYEPLVKMMAIANQNSVLGMEMQRRALEFMYSTKRIEEEEAGKDRRAEKWMEWLKKPANVAVKQFGRYMTAKATGQAPAEDEDEDEDDNKPRGRRRGGFQRTAPQQDAPASSSPSSSSAEEAQPEGPTEETIANPVATLAMALGQLLRPTQFSQAAAILTKKQLALFASLIESETDEDAVEIYTKIEDGGIPLMKLHQLSAILDERQSEGLEQLVKFIERAREGWSEGGE
jgi:hypothetical protein